MPAPLRRVAALVRPTPGWSRAVLHGIGRYGHARRDWLLYPIYSSDPAALEAMGGERIDGVLGTDAPDTPQSAYLRLACPVVMVAGGSRTPGLPRVTQDDEALGRLAAEHLLAKGLTEFGYVGPENQTRGRAFAHAVAAAGRRLRTLTIPVVVGPSGYGASTEKLRPWLAELPKPAGVMAFSDPLAAAVTEAARVADIAVPEDLAVLGVDDDDIVCGFSNPPLSSVDPDFERVGYEAAALLDRLLSGEPPPPEPRRVPPRGVVERQSTSVLAFGDPDVRAAVRFIRERALDGIHVPDIVEHVGLSRRTLESRFRPAVGRTLHDEIWRHRIDHAARLLRQTDFDLARISVECSFASLAHLSRTIKAVTGLSPRDYRRQHRDVRSFRAR